MFSSNSYEWETPQDLFDMLDAEFHFTLDPCATPENAKCERFFTKEDNGLLQDWYCERAFVNPPYGREISKWVEKSYHEALYNGALVVMLIPARTDTRYWHDFVMNAEEIRLIKGRLYFGDGTKRAPFPSAVIIFNRRFTGKPIVKSMEI
jgi:site-specific DNA-methyltransferase (adenine-specific)